MTAFDINLMNGFPNIYCDGFIKPKLKISKFRVMKEPAENFPMCAGLKNRHNKGIRVALILQKLKIHMGPNGFPF